MSLVGLGLGVAACGAVSPGGGRVALDAGFDLGLADAGRLEETILPGPDVGFDSPVRCAPGSIATFTPTYNAPVGPYAGKCSDAQLQYAVSNCFGKDGPTMDCVTWATATKDNTPCLDCLTGSWTSSMWAPLLYVDNGGQAIFVDLAACVVLSDPAQLKCGQSIESLVECELTACLNACPIAQPTDDAGALQGCTDQAAKTACATYASAVDHCAATIHSTSSMSAAAYCFDASPMDGTDLYRFLRLSCGQAQAVDGGSPPPPPPVDASISPG